MTKIMKINPATARDRADDVATEIASAATTLAPAIAESFWQNGPDAAGDLVCFTATQEAARAMLTLAVEISSLRLEGAMHFLATGNLAEAVALDNREAERHDAAVAAITATGATPCNCEHARHWADSAARSRIAHDGHRALEVPAGKHHARYIGAVCDECAERCVADYLLD